MATQVADNGNNDVVEAPKRHNIITNGQRGWSAPLSLCKPAVVLPSFSPRSGAVVDGGGDANGVAGATSIDGWYSEKQIGSDPVTSDSADNSEPEGRVSSRIRVGEADDRSSRLSEGARLFVLCLTATISGGGDVDLEAEVDAAGSGVLRRGVLAQVSMFRCVARVMTGFDKVAGIRRFSVVV